MPSLLFEVGILWSATAKVLSGLRTFLLVFRNPSNACGLVTSWTKCLSIYNILAAFGSECTK